jgi:peptidoglycan DL-endopeptidase CwlO
MEDLTLRGAAYPGDTWRPPQPEAAPSEATRQRPRRPSAGPIQRVRRLAMTKEGRRPVVAGAVICTLLCALISRPAYADPNGTTVPDSGVRPVPAGPLQLPGQGGTASTDNGTQLGPPVLGPLGNQIMTETVAVQTMEGQATQARLDYERARDTAAAAEQTWREAADRTAQLRAKADVAAADAYKTATGLGPYSSFAGGLHKFSVLAPGLGPIPGGEAAARDLLRAEKEEKAAHDAFLLANSVEQTSRTKSDNLKASLDQRSAALVDLRRRNAAEVARIEAQRDAYEQSLGGANLADNTNIDGMQANPLALAAVARALSKLGSPYLWGAEGPDRFDCSGLAYWAYKIGPGANASLALPRVANDMYHGTPAVPATRVGRGDLLLPGDLVFFASNLSDWHSIFHMGIYIGGGRMVHAPTTGDFVKISPVMWSRFFGATRIYTAVPKATTPASQPGPTSTSVSPSHSASPSQSSSSSAPASRSAPPSPGPIPSPRPIGSSSPSGTTTSQSSGQSAPAAVTTSGGSPTPTP